MRLASLALVLALTSAAPVIGLGENEHFCPLRNSVVDAQAVAERLETLGVEITHPLETTGAEFDDFAFRAETGDLAIDDFAGHGV